MQFPFSMSRGCILPFNYLKVSQIGKDSNQTGYRKTVALTRMIQLASWAGARIKNNRFDLEMQLPTAAKYSHFIMYDIVPTALK